MSATTMDVPTLHLSLSQVKQFNFTWSAVPGAEYYQLFESVDGVAPFVQIGGNIKGESVSVTMPLHLRLNARYKLLAWIPSGWSESAILDMFAYVKASNTDAYDGFGAGVALSRDGNTLAVGASGEDSKAAGIGGDQSDNSAERSGAVYVFVRSGGAWTQQAYVKASNSGAGDFFGASVALSADGNTLAVGARWEDSGAVYVFVRSGGAWSQQAYVKASNTGVSDDFGGSLALSADGNTLAVGAFLEDGDPNYQRKYSGAVYVYVRDGDDWTFQFRAKPAGLDAYDLFGGSVALSDDGDTLAVGAAGDDGMHDLKTDSGAVYVFVRNGGVWSQQYYNKVDFSHSRDQGDAFGTSVALSGDGNTLAVGSSCEDSHARGIDGADNSNLQADSGAVYVFVRKGGVWSQQAYVKASNTGALARFGGSVALSSDGNTLAVGATREASNATGIGGNQSNWSARDSGAVYVFVRNGGAWSQRAYVKASNTGAGDSFGRSVALSGDGNTLAVGASGEGSSATGVDGNQADNSAVNSGAVYLYGVEPRSAESAVVEVLGSLEQAIGCVKASNRNSSDYFGNGVALSGDGNTLAVGAAREDSNATGIGGNQADNSAGDSGAVYVFVRDGGAWTQQAYVKASNAGAGDLFGESVALSADGNTLVVGAIGEDSNATGIGGNQADNSAELSGAVYVFVRNGGTWTQQAYVKASNTGASDLFGRPVALSADGNTLAVGAAGEDSNATGIGGNQADDSASSSGAVYVFVRSGGAWSQQAYVKASNTGGDSFGRSVALSDNGNTLAVGAVGEDSNATGIGGNQADDSASDSGAVYVFVRNGGTWSQQAYVKASNTGAGDFFGYALGLSGDGNTLAASAWKEDSNAKGIGGNQADDSAGGSGAVYVFVRNRGAWSQQAYVKASNTDADDSFGFSLALSSDGNTLAVGAVGEDGNAKGIGGYEANNSVRSRGAVYVFVRKGLAWSQRAYVKPPNAYNKDQTGLCFGGSVALSNDGDTLAVGAQHENAQCGMVYLY